ncbi:MBL fold metallo-hydrolase [Chachezhania sediminis]|uniref:MBL fold metallo-hydrolase n=1 Tax=Chachezhania sediminis TaxID=2599291 RepID=UPI00131BB76C|nr:MBL fold metallo-hydrolase [Chachezhania sediminis]
MVHAIKTTPAPLSAAALTEPPAPGETIEVAPGVLWMRFPLPFQLDHVNLYLIEDDDGFALLDTGICDDRTKEIWDHAFQNALKGIRLSRLIVSHHHPDHIGLAGWMTERFGIPLHMTLTEYLMGSYLGLGPFAEKGHFYSDFYLKHGATAEQAKVVAGRGLHYLQMVSGLPDDFIALDPSQGLTLGGRKFEVLTGGGHSVDQAMLYCRDENFFMASDQIIERISPNVSVHAMEPHSDPLGAFVRSLNQIKRVVPADAVTFSGHRLPIAAPHVRADELIAHHDERLDKVVEIVSPSPLTTAEITPLLFHRQLDPHQFSFAFSEALAHVNRLVEDGRLEWLVDDGIHRVRPT